MSIHERPHLRSIPPRTRPRVDGRINPPSWQQGETNWGQVVQRENVFRKPPPNGSKMPEADAGRKISLSTETMDEWNSKGDLGVILSFNGLNLNKVDFRRGVGDYGPDSAVFYTPVGYNGSPAALIVATFGDILETQVVPRRIDVDPFFRDERVIKELAACDPTSMKVLANNGIIVVSYQKR